MSTMILRIGCHEILLDQADATRRFSVTIGGFERLIIPYLTRWEVKASGNTFYASYQAMAGGVRKRFTLHRLIAIAPDGTVVDHVNHNGLDNRRDNLRVCSHGENQQNRLANKGKTFKGVSFHKRSGKFEASIGLNGSKQYLGLCATPEQAASRYDLAAESLFGDFACLNNRETAK